MTAVVTCMFVAAAVSEPFVGVPADATLVVVVPHPRSLVETLRDWPGVARLTQLPAVQEALAAPNLKRLGDLVAYYERDLGDEWPVILDRVAGRGVTLAAVAGQDNGPVVVSVRGTDPDASRQFVELAVRAAVAEAANQAAPGAAPPKVTRETVHDSEVIRIGTDVHIAIRGATVWVSNRSGALKKSLDVLAGGAKPLGPKRPLAGRALLDPAPAAWAWVDLKALKDTPQARDFFANTRKEIVGTLVFGSSIDAVGRADDLALGLAATMTRLSVQLMAGAGRGGLAPELNLHAPPAGGVGSLPLLRPPGAVYSQGFYLDVATLWADRSKVFNPQALKDVEKFDQDASKVLPGAGFGEMLKMVGPHPRIVLFAPAEKPLYRSTPSPAQPGSVLVLPMRDEQLGEDLSAALRAGAALAGFATGLTLADETHDGIPMAVARFAEGRKLEADPEGLRYHAMPSFVTHKGFFLLASRPDLIARTVAELDRTAEAGTGEVWRAELLPQGLAGWVRTHPDALVADALQRRSLSLERAQGEVEQFAEWLAESGRVMLTADNGPKSFAWTLTWNAQREAK